MSVVVLYIMVILLRKGVKVRLERCNAFGSNK